MFCYKAITSKHFIIIKLKKKHAIKTPDLIKCNYTLVLRVPCNTQYYVRVRSDLGTNV